MKYVLKYILFFVFIPFFLFSACKGTFPDELRDATGGPSPVCVTPQHGWADAILYFVLIDRFADGDPANNVDVNIAEKGFFHGGDLKGLTDRLDDLADLGVTAVWINPVVKNIDHYVEGAGFPDWAYHGYWADDFYQIDSRFGSEQEMQAFVRACHDRGIKVLLDVVYNHVGYESHYLKKPNANDWLRTGRRESLCGEDDITQCVAGLPDVKTEDPETADFVLTAHMDWARRFGVDGFRLDTVKHIDHDFWQTHRARADRELGENFFLLGEIWGGDRKVLEPYFQSDEIDAGFDFSFTGSVQGFALGRGRTIAFSRYLAKRHKVVPGHHLCHYLSSHDVAGALFRLEGDRELYKICAAIQFTSIGIPMIYYGEEVGRIGGDWPENRSDMPWGDRDILPGKGLPRDEEMRDYYKQLIQMRRAHPALWRGDYRELSTEGDLLVFGRHDPASGEAVIVAVNRGAGPAAAEVPLPDQWQGSKVLEALSGKPASVSGAVLKVDVPGRWTHIYVCEQN